MFAPVFIQRIVRQHLFSDGELYTIKPVREFASTKEQRVSADFGTVMLSQRKEKERMKKRLLALAVCCVVCLAAIVGGKTAQAADTSSLSNGDIVVFGSYPQKKVTDSSLINKLDGVSKSWKAYPYYSKNTNSTEAQTFPTKKNTSMMQYADFTYSGKKYRAVKILQYRPIDVLKPTDSEYKQQSNGYIKGTVYYFEYEPIRWVVLDKSAGLLVSEKVLDAQPLNAYYKIANNKAMSAVNDKVGASNYYYSTVRHWLNADGNFDSDYGNFNFLNTAFSSTERSAMSTCTYAFYDGTNSTVAKDYVFLLSKTDAEATKNYYTSTDNTDYAEAQGMSKRGGSTGTPWYTCTYVNNTTTYYVQDCTVNSTSALFSVITSTQTGIRPAIKVDLSSSSVIGPLKLKTKTSSKTGNPILVWNSIPGATSYSVYRCGTTSSPDAAASWGSPIATLGADVTEYEDPSAVALKGYYYRVKVTKSSGTETSNYLLVQYPIARPSISTATRDAETGRPSITWKTVEGASSYEIQRLAPGSSWTYLTTATAATTTTQTFKDTTAKVGNQYKYRVKAIASQGTAYNSIYSVEATARCTLPRPSGVTKSDSDMGMPRISWNAVSGASGYRVQYKKTSDTEWKETITTLTSINLNDAEYGQTYSFRVSATYSGDSSGMYESAAATGSITCAWPPSFTKQPQDYIVFSNQTQIFPTVQSAGKGITYDWYAYRPEKGVYEYVNVYSGSNMWSIIPTTEDDGMLYYVIATDKFGRTKRSNTGIITVMTQPSSKTALVDSKVTFSTTTKYYSDNIASYQWQYRKNNVGEWTDSNAASAKTATYAFTVKAGHNGYQFRCVVTDKNGKQAFSGPVTLTVKPKITTQPKSTSVLVGNKATFTVAATGKATLKYQWQYKAPGATTWTDSKASSAKTATLSFAATAGQNGYQFRCVVTDGNGQQTASNAAKLTVKPKITTQPKSTTVKAGSKATFTVAATGKATLKYQWQYKAPGATTWTDSKASSAKTATFSFTTKAGQNNYQFRCVVTDGNGNQTPSNAVTLTVK